MDATVREACGLLGVSEDTLYRWIREEGLPARRVGERYRFHRAELLEWAALRGKTVSPGAFAAAGPVGGPPSLGGALRRGGVHRRVPGEDKAAALAAVVRLLKLPKGVDRGFVRDVLLARESLGSTGIGDGIALPHVRSPIVLHVDSPVVSLCFLARPVDYGALDGKPVHTLFALVCPSIQAHLRLLASLSFALKDEAFHRAVIERKSEAAILKACVRAEKRLGPGA